MRRLLLAAATSAVLLVAGCGTSGKVNANGSWSSSASPGTAAASSTPPETATTQPPPSDPPPSNTLPDPGATGSRAGLTIQVTGKCSDLRGFRLSSTGFTPNGQYRTIAWYPDGKQYRYLINGGFGTADGAGATPNWTWDCQDGAGGKPDPEGVYTLVMVDVSTGRWVVTRFRVQY